MGRPGSAGAVAGAGGGPGVRSGTWPPAWSGAASRRASEEWTRGALSAPPGPRVVVRARPADDALRRGVSAWPRAAALAFTAPPLSRRERAPSALSSPAKFFF